MIDIKMMGLGALEEHHLSGIECLVEQHADVDDVRFDSLRIGEQVLGDLRRIDLSPVVDLDQQVVLLLECRLDLLREDRLVEQVLNAQPEPVDLVGVRGTHATPGRTDPGLPKKALGDFVDHLVV